MCRKLDTSWLFCQLVVVVVVVAVVAYLQRLISGSKCSVDCSGSETKRAASSAYEEML